MGDGLHDITLSLNSVTNTSSPAIVLVQKLVMVLESCEKLPVLTYEGLGGGTGLQVGFHIYFKGK